MYILYLYTNQTLSTRWISSHSDTFSVSNGVRQGAVISPLLFTIYIDTLFTHFEHLGVGCHIDTVYAGSVGYADDIALVSATLYGMNHMITVFLLYLIIISLNLVRVMFILATIFF